MCTTLTGPIVSFATSQRRRFVVLGLLAIVASSAACGGTPNMPEWAVKSFASRPARPVDTADERDCCGRDLLALRFGNDLGRVEEWLAGRSNPDVRDGRGQTLLHNAAAYGRADLVALLLSAGADVDAVEHEGRTPLHLACAYGEVETARALLGAKPKRDVRDDEGYTAVSMAVGAPGVLELVLDAGFSPDLGDPLKLAVASSLLEAVKLLLGAGAKPTNQALDWSVLNKDADPRVALALIDAGVVEKPADGVNALTSAAENGFVEVIDRLVAVGVDLDGEVGGQTALEEAAMNGHVAIVERLLAAGASLETNDMGPLTWAILRGQAEVVELLLEKGARPHGLASAAENGDLRIVEALLAAGAATDGAIGAAATREKDGGSGYVHEWRHDEVLKLLVESGARPSADEERSNAELRRTIASRSSTAAVALIQSGAALESPSEWENDPPIVRLALQVGLDDVALELVRRGAAPGGPDEDGLTPLHWASRAGASAVVEWLLAHGAKPRQRAGGGATAVAWAAWAGDLWSLKLLVRRGAPCNDRGILRPDPDGSSYYGGALAAAAGRGHLSVVRHLVESCRLRVGEPEAALDGKTGWTPLQWASARGHADVVQYLLSRGAVASEATADGKSAAELAASSGSAETLSLLLDAGSPVGSALELAVGAGRVDALRLLLDRGGAAQGKHAAWAIANERGEAARLLLDSGADANTVIEKSDGEGNKQAHTLLELAIRARDRTTVELLLSRGVSIGPDALVAAVEAASDDDGLLNLLLSRAPPLDSPDRDGETPLGCALSIYPEERIEPVADLLIANGARDPGPELLELSKGERRDSARLFEHLLDAGAGLKLVDEEGETPLTRALATRNLRLARRLVVAGQDRALACDGRTIDPFARAAELGDWDVAASLPRRCRRDHEVAGTRVLSLAVQAGQRALVAELLRSSRPDRRENLLHLAAATNDVTLLDMLIRSGLDPAARDSAGTTPLHAAAAADAGRAVHNLVQAKTPVDARDPDGWSALDMTLVQGAAPSARLLLGAGASLGSEIEDGMSALHLAARGGDGELIEALKRRGARVSAKTSSGQTPLHLAAAAGEPSVVRALLAAGARVGISDRAGRTPLHLAAYAGRSKIVKVLLKAADSPHHAASVGDALIQFALTNGHREVLRELVAGGVVCQEPPREFAPSCVERAMLLGETAVAARLAAAPGAGGFLSSEGWPLLHFAILREADDVAAALIAANADVDQAVELPFWRVHTPLTLAVRRRDPALAKKLITAGANPDRRLSDGRSARDDATELDDPATTKALGPMRRPR